MTKALTGFIKAKNKLSIKQLAVYAIIFGLVGGTILWLTLAASNPNLPSDFNNDNTVNVTDLSILLSDYGTTNSAADINGDGTVNVLDLSSMLSNYGKSYTPVGTVFWRGDYETGDFSQWWLNESVGGNGCGVICTPTQLGNTSATIVSNPVVQGHNAAQFRVQPCSSGCPNDRAEVVASQAQTGGYLGQEWWYGWWTYFPAGQSFWSGGGDWNVFTQFHGGASIGPVDIIGINSADYPSPQLQEDSIFTGRHLIGPLQFNHWYHFIVHEKYQQDTSGIFQIYVDGSLVTDLHEPTMASGASPLIHVSQGYYSNAASDNTVIHDGMCRASDYNTAAGC